MIPFMPLPPGNADAIASLLRAGGGVRFADQPAQARLAGLLEGPPLPWRLVKQTVSRSVYCAANGQGSLYLKCFHNPSLLHRLQRRLGWCDSLRELERSRYLRSRGLPVPVVLAACSQWNISQGVADASPADQWHLEQLRRENHAAIAQAAAALAQIIARMHQAGVLHHDLHCGNLLVGRDDPRRLCLMDLHRTSRRVRLNRHSRAANLAQLAYDRWWWTSRTQRLRFLRDYLRSSGAGGSLRGWVRLIEPQLQAHRRRMNAHRRRRILRTNTHFVRLAAGGYTAHVVRTVRPNLPGSRLAGATFEPDHWRAALADVEGLFHGSDVRVVKDSPSSLVVQRRLQVGPHALEVFIKRARRKKPIRLVWDLFRHSRPVRAFRLGHLLLSRQINTALPLAAMERRRGRFLIDSLLITEAVDEALELNRFLNRHLGGEEAQGPAHQGSLARKVLWRLGRLVRQLHQEGFYHRDLKATNLLVRWNGQPTHWPEIVLIDLDGLHTARRVSRRQQLQGIMRLNVSLLECPIVNHAGRLRLLLGYLRAARPALKNFKPYWRMLQEWSAKKIRRQIRSRQRSQKQARRNLP
jgi:tRNA A-37 threonylcarbamoyl transferase component Bud32